MKEIMNLSSVEFKRIHSGFENYNFPTSERLQNYWANNKLKFEPNKETVFNRFTHPLSDIGDKTI